jgi:RNA polymerase sigma-70 factor (ECF subfamily)
MEADFALLDAARTMNVEALTKIFDLYSRPLYKYAFRLCNDAGLADQIVGDVFSRLLEHLSAGQGPRANLRSYLYETAYHVVIDEARYSHRAIAIEVIDFVQHDGYSTHAAVENRVLFETVRRAIQNDLTEDQRHVVVLRFLEGFSLKETAAIMGKNVGSVKVIQNRAIAALRKALDHQVVEPRAVSSGLRSLEASMVGD